MKLSFKSPWTFVPAALLLFVLAIPMGATFAALAEPLLQTPAAQQDPAAQNPLLGAPEPAQAIPATEIATRAEELGQRLADINRVIDLDPQVTATEEGLPEAEQTVSEDFEQLEAIDPDTVLRLTVENLQQRWQQHRLDLAVPLTTVTTRYEGLEEERIALQRIEDRWQATLERLDPAQPELVPAQPEEVTAPLRDRIEQVLGSIDETQTRLQSRSAAVLAIQGRVSSLDARVTEALTRIGQLETEVRQRVLARDSVPLWSATMGEIGDLYDEAVEAGAERRRTVVSFYRGDPDGATIHALVFLVLVVAGFALRRHVSEWKEIAGAGALVHVLSRPISGAAIFSLLLTGWMYTAVRWSP